MGMIGTSSKYLHPNPAGAGPTLIYSCTDCHIDGISISDYFMFQIREYIARKMMKQQCNNTKRILPQQDDKFVQLTMKWVL